MTPVASAVSDGIGIFLGDVKWIAVLLGGFYIGALVMGTIKEKSLNIIVNCMFVIPAGGNNHRWQWVNVMLVNMDECVLLVSIVYCSIMSKETRKLILKSVQSLIEHSPYCFGKILDHLRLKNLNTQELAGEPMLPSLYNCLESRFKKIVKYYFPGDLAKFILG